MEIPRACSGMRLDRAAAELLPAYSRSQLASWIRAGVLTLDEKKVPPRYLLNGGEKLVLRARPIQRENWHTAQKVPFQVVFEDENLLVINKPAGVVVHPGAGNPDGTLVNGLLAYRHELSELPRAGLIHRLDKETSGLLVVAADLMAFNALTRALASHDIERHYMAITEGVLSGGRDIEAEIGRDARQRKRQQVRPGGRYALTRVRVKQKYRAHTLIDAQLATGRTHQIRVHLSSIGHPLLGDRLYAARGRLPKAPLEELRQEIAGFRRQALHAKRLSFAHPVTAQRIRCEAEPPSDLANLIRVLKLDLDLAGRSPDPR